MDTQPNIPPQSVGGTNVAFTDEQPSVVFKPQTPKMMELVMKYSGGYIQNESQAGYALLGFVGLAVIVSLFFAFGGSSAPKEPPFMDNSFVPLSERQ